MNVIVARSDLESLFPLPIIRRGTGLSFLAYGRASHAYLLRSICIGPSKPTCHRYSNRLQNLNSADLGREKTSTYPGCVSKSTRQPLFKPQPSSGNTTTTFYCSTIFPQLIAEKIKSTCLSTTEFSVCYSRAQFLSIYYRSTHLRRQWLKAEAMVTLHHYLLLSLLSMTKSQS